MAPQKVQCELKKAKRDEQAAPPQDNGSTPAADCDTSANMTDEREVELEHQRPSSHRRTVKELVALFEALTLNETKVPATSAHKMRLAGDSAEIRNGVGPVLIWKRRCGKPAPKVCHVRRFCMEIKRTKYRGGAVGNCTGGCGEEAHKGGKDGGWSDRGSSSDTGDEEEKMVLTIWRSAKSDSAEGFERNFER